MVANKIVLAVALVSVASVQINARPAEGEIAWVTQYENALKNLTSKFTELTGDTSEYTDLAKKSMSSFAEDLKSNLTSLYTTLEGKTGVTDVVKDGVKQWQAAVEKYSKKTPEGLFDVKRYNEEFENALKYVAQTATDLSKKAGGNTEIEKTIKEFTKGQIDGLMDHVKTIRSKLNVNQA